jgi:hypothetical protein
MLRKSALETFQYRTVVGQKLAGAVQAEATVAVLSCHQAGHEGGKVQAIEALSHATHHQSRFQLDADRRTVGQRRPPVTVCRVSSVGAVTVPAVGAVTSTLVRPSCSAASWSTSATPCLAWPRSPLPLSLRKLAIERLMSPHPVLQGGHRSIGTPRRVKPAHLSSEHDR